MQSAIHLKVKLKALHNIRYAYVKNKKAAAVTDVKGQSLEV